MSRPARPAILLVFANPRRDLALKRETSGIRAALRQRRDLEIIILDHPALPEVEDTFQDRRNQIVAFHYSGHANGFQQMLESEHGTEQRIYTHGFAEFLASQESLRFVFLNGCSTAGQVEDFFAAGVPCVLATKTDVDDELATTFSLRFYSGLASGTDIQTAYKDAVGAVKAVAAELPASAVSRGIRIGNRGKSPEAPFPWQLHAQSDSALDWSLDQEAGRRRPTREKTNEVSQIQLQRLLNLVEDHWISSVLERNLPAGMIAVRKTFRYDLVDDPLEGLSDENVSGRQTGELDESVLAHYRRVQNRLLLLGGPGSGKTTELLQLAKELIHTAHQDPALPVPVVLSLSRWSDARKSFYDWLQSQLSELYSVPRRLTAEWLDNHELILLLDAVDEVDGELRAGCIREINQFLDETGASGIVVTSRVDDYSSMDVRLRLAGALQLQPLNATQISYYVSSGGERLAAMNASLGRNESLRSLAQSPLLLNIMSQVYEDQTVTEPGEVSIPAAVETKDLFNRFIDRMFRRRNRTKPKFSRMETEAGLVWLANRMQENGSTLFLLEWMQPSWLSRRQWLIYCLLMGILPGVFFGATLGFFWWCTAHISSDTARAIEHGLWWWPTILCTVWFLIACAIDQFLPNFAARGDWNRWKNLSQGVIKAGVYYAAWAMMILMLLFAAPDSARPQLMALILTGAIGSSLLAASGWHHRTMQDIRPAESIAFSWRKACYAATIGLAIGVAVWILFRAIWSNEPNIRFAFYDTDHSHGFLYVFVCLSIVGAISGAIVGGVQRAELIHRMRPNQGIINSRRNAFTVGLAAGAIMTLVTFSLMMMQDLRGTGRTVVNLALFSIGIGWSTFACSATLSGGFDALKNQILRRILTVSKQVPKPFEDFLSYACELSLLKPVGGGYLFLHRLLMEHFANEKCDRESSVDSTAKSSAADLAGSELD